MPRRSSHIQSVMQVASDQDGLITARQLRELGVPRSTTGRRTALGHMWSRVLPGVHLVTGGHPSRHQRERAALLYAGPRSMLTGASSLRYYGLADALPRVEEHDQQADEVHVLVEHAKRLQSRSFLLVERTIHLPEHTNIRTLRIAPAARSVADAARRMRWEDQVTTLVIAAVRRNIVTPEALREEAELGPRRGSAYLRAAAIAAGAGVWSAPEARVRRLLLGMDLPEPQFNVAIVSARGEYIATPDAWIDSVGLAIETDSQQFHSASEGWANTLRRQSRYSKHGVTVVSILPTALRTQPTEVAREIAEAYELASSRPRPAVLVRRDPSPGAA